jgi:hypothetical protein
MAAASYSVITVIDQVKTHINDVANTLGADGDFDGLGGSASDDLTYKQIMLANIIPSGEQTLTLTKQTTGVYTYSASTDDTALWFANNTTPFTGEDDVVYQVYGKGPAVFVSSGAPTATEISIAGAWINWREMLAQTFFWLADTKATQIALSVESETIDPGAVRDALNEQGRLAQGTLTSAT